MSDNFDQMIKDFKSMVELKKFSEAQHKTIIELTKKINSLQKENETIRDTLKVQNVQLPEIKQDLNAITDEEVICRTQLSVLKNKSLLGELTLEEAKKVDIFSKIILSIEQQGKKTNSTFEQLSNDELLALVDGKKELN